MLQPGTFTARLLAVALLIAAAMFSYRLAILPYWQLHQGNLEKIDQAERRLERYERIIEETPRLKDQLETLRHLEEQIGAYVPSPGDNLASEEPWVQILALVEKSGGELLGTEALEVPETEDETPSPVDRTGLHLEFRITMAGLADTLYDIEIIEPKLMIEQLHVLPLEAGDDEPRLEVRLDVFGHSRQSGS